MRTSPKQEAGRGANVPFTAPAPAPVSLAEVIVPLSVDASEVLELAASRVFIAAFRAWCVDTNHYSRMMAAFAAYQNVIRKTEP